MLPVDVCMCVFIEVEVRGSGRRGGGPERKLIVRREGETSGEAITDSGSE